MVDRPDVLLSLAANWLGAVRILVAGAGDLSLAVHTGVSLRGDLWGGRGNKPDGVRVAKGIGGGNRLMSALGLHGHDFRST